MKIPLVIVMVLAFATAAAAQQPAKQPPPSAASSSSTADNAFVTKIAHVNIAEIELGKLAQDKAMSDEVKKFGQRMVDDHSKASDDLKALATRKNVTWPTETDAEHKALSDRLSKMSGAEFDRAYMQAMVDGHRKMMGEFRTEIKSGKDAEVKAWAEKTLPTIEAHLKQAQSVNRGEHSGSSTHP